MVTRRLFLAGAGVLFSGGSAFAQSLAPDPRMADRAEGRPDAPNTVVEWFSFTCHFCAHFAADVLPEVKAKLIDTGKLRLVFREYPRDQADLIAAMVARSLPPERYEPFMTTLLATQQHWAFDRGVDPKEELAKMAALAGMPREMFDRVVADDALKAAILAAQTEVERTYSINATPTFVVRGEARTGEVGTSYEGFAKMVSGA